ncbi:MAG: XRE family transcriptional regulator [Faecalibacillus faecis]
MAIDTELAKRLRSYRNFKHLTQKGCCCAFKCSYSAIDIENGKRDITVSELKVFSNLYGRSEEIMSGKYDYYNIANIARLLTELPDDDLKESCLLLNIKKRNEERHLK